MSMIGLGQHLQVRTRPYSPRGGVDHFFMLLRTTQLERAYAIRRVLARSVIHASCWCIICANANVVAAAHQ
eukprot:scaffold98767_cov32-Tisochrysis_lutea.AAC.7